MRRDFPEIWRKKQRLYRQNLPHRVQAGAEFLLIVLICLILAPGFVLAWNL